MVKYKFWFPEEGTLDIENWDRVGENLKTAHRRGDRIPVPVFVTYRLFKDEVVSSDKKMLTLVRTVSHVEVETEL